METNLKCNQTVTYIFKCWCRYVQDLSKFKCGSWKLIPGLFNDSFLNALIHAVGNSMEDVEVIPELIY
jgi:hypothetical protein